jgi:hypothetical protein
MVIIGISGKKQSGKDTVADIILNNSPLLGSKVGFALSLKLEIAKACGVDFEFIENNKPVFRPMLQWWGTDFRRKFEGEDYWLNKMDEIIESTEASLKLDFLIVSDVRFINEADWVKAKGGVLIRVDRPNATQDTHISEIQLDNYKGFDYRITNNSNLFSLEVLVKQMKLI